MQERLSFGAGKGREVEGAWPSALLNKGNRHETDKYDPHLRHAFHGQDVWRGQSWVIPTEVRVMTTAEHMRDDETLSQTTAAIVGALLWSLAGVSLGMVVALMVAAGV